MTEIIAEIGTSHEGSLEKAMLLSDTAVAAGATTIKFQWVYADEILHPNTGLVQLPTGNIPLYERFKQLECSKTFYKSIMDYVHSKGCKFCCSPFGLRSLNELLELKPDFVKIASPELNHYKMLESLRDYRKEEAKSNGIKGQTPVILSSGVSHLSDIEKALEILGRDNVSLLHCITSYPAPEDEYNVRLISNLKAILGVETGLSDHSLNPILVPVLSVAMGGTIIEKHFTLSKQNSGLDDPVALESEEFATMVHVVRQTEATFRHYGKEVGMERTLEQLSLQFGKKRVEKVLGDGVKRLASSEEKNYGRSNRSLHFMHNMKVGDIIRKEDIAILRTEKELLPGISPIFYETILGSRLTRDVSSGQGVLLEDVISKA